MAKSSAERAHKCRVRKARKAVAPAVNLANKYSATSIFPALVKDDAWHRQYLQNIELLSSDRGGWQRMSEAQKVLVQRSAALGIVNSFLTARCADEGMNASERLLKLFYCSIAAERRCLETLGMTRSEVPLGDEPEIIAPQQITKELHRRAFAESNDAALLALHRSAQARETGESDGPPIFVVFENSTPPGDKK